MSDEPGEQEGEDDFWQWVLLVVLLACWMAETYL